MSTKLAPIIRKVTIRYFKKFEHQEFDLKPMTLLIGTNNHGKTSLLQALSSWQLAYNTWKTTRRITPGAIRRKLRGVPIALPNFHAVPLIDFKHLWTDKKTQWFDQAAYGEYEKRKEQQGDKKGQSAPKYQGAYDVEILVEWEEPTEAKAPEDAPVAPREQKFGMQFHYENEQSIIVKPTAGTESVPASLDSIVLTHIPPFSGLDPFEEYLADGAIRRRIGLCQPGSVVRNLLWRVFQDRERWKELKTNVERFIGVRLLDPKFAQDIDPHITCQYEDLVGSGRGPFDLVNGGSGFHQLLTLFAIVYWNQGTHLLLDEPDAHLHAWAQAGILDFLRDRSRKGEVQILIATHSLALLDRSEPEDVYSLMSDSPTWLVADKEKFSVRSGLDAVETSLLTFLQRTPFVLYVEGTSDIQILRLLAKAAGKDDELFERLPIHTLGTRDPKQAREHFLGVRSFSTDTRGLCVLDPDTDPTTLKEQTSHLKEEGLEYHVWNRRHVESYLLVPEAIGRAVIASDKPLFADAIARRFRDFLSNPPHGLVFPSSVSDYATLELNWMATFDAKRYVFSPDATDKSFVSSLKRGTITPQHVAQWLRPNEIHQDVVRLLDRLYALAASRPDSKACR